MRYASPQLHLPRVLLAAFLAFSAALGVVAPASSQRLPPSPPPIIVDATGDLVASTLTINGANFGAASPRVYLGGFVAPLVVTTATPTHVVVTLPAGILAGSYLLSLLTATGGAEEFWVALGSQGVPGPQGPAGVAGPAGMQGVPGVSGPAGLQGLQGQRGLAGEAGPAGIQGVAGVPGPAGVQGQQGVAGEAGPAGMQGVAGTPGPAGIQGQQGLVGEAGPAGIQGVPGVPGPAGSQGQQGPAGVAGPAGPSGVSAFAYIFNTGAQVVPIEAAVGFDTTGVLVGVTHVAGQAAMVVDNAGTYEIAFALSGVEPNQFGLFVNGSPAAGGVYGSGAGTQQTNGLAILALAAGDVVTLVNHSSAAAVTLQTLAGGTQNNVNVSVRILKLN